ncbi:MAG: hypothetical protein HRT47_01620 [Candidatus Caenarcaniphilales bacterium]|nr:hypothetical protein [Candidatus Caenarcaniphilales bacterium]
MPVIEGYKYPFFYFFDECIEKYTKGKDFRDSFLFEERSKLCDEILDWVAEVKNEKNVLRAASQMPYEEVHIYRDKKKNRFSYSTVTHGDYVVFKDDEFYVFKPSFFEEIKDSLKEVINDKK